MLANEQNSIEFNQNLKESQIKMEIVDNLAFNIKSSKLDQKADLKLLDLKQGHRRQHSTESIDDAETNYVSVEDNTTVSGLSKFELQELILSQNKEDPEKPSTGKIVNTYYTYVGEILKGKRHGFGSCKYKTGDYYTGQWNNDKVEGYGRLLNKSSEVYTGEFNNGQPCGFIEHETPKAITFGEMRDWKFIGEVVCKKKDKYVIEASVSYDQKNQMTAFGVIDDLQGNLYEGEMMNYSPCGWGIQVKKNKFTYKGQQDKGFNGYGEVYCVDGTKYFGFFKNNKKHGIVINFNVKEGRISFAKYLADSKNGATLNIYKSGLKVEIWHDGYRVKLIENFELAKQYIKSCYPEHEWILTLEYMSLISFFGKLNCNCK